MVSDDICNFMKDGWGYFRSMTRIILCFTSHGKKSRVVKFAELSPYKYAGYGQLIKTINLESKDDALFANGGGRLLSAAIELCRYTLMSSALNAEQLRREAGLEVTVSFCHVRNDSGFFENILTDSKIIKFCEV